MKIETKKNEEKHLRLILAMFHRLIILLRGHDGHVLATLCPFIREERGERQWEGDQRHLDFPTAF